MEEVGLAGLAAVSALGRGAEAQLAGALAGTAPFTTVQRFSVDKHRVKIAATLPDAGGLPDELADAVDHACTQAGLTRDERAATPLILAVHAFPDAPRVSIDRWRTPAELAEFLSGTAGTGPVARVYTSACVSGSTAVAEAAGMIRAGRAKRVVVAGGYLVESDQFALFSVGRTGLLLGDAVAAVVLESVAVTRRRARTELAQLAGWGRAGDAFHAVQPHPEGDGMARAISAALRRAGIEPAALGYINAHGTGTPYSDTAEAAALHRALGPAASRVPISSTKATHGHALEASALIELVVTVLAMRAGKLPVNTGFLAPDPDCELNVITSGPRSVNENHALSINAAFGGANTALVVKIP
jgi:3-oxoacyl-[acyl-carrier-protein] synthase II